MKANLLPIIFCLCTFPILAQNKEARKVTEFGIITCSYFNALLGSAYEDYKNTKDVNIYIFYYEAKNQEVFVWNKKKKIEERKIINPRRGNALNRAKEVPLFLETVYKLPKDKFVLIDGGFRENMEIEVWLVPKNANPPKPNPTVDAKDVKFDKGKPFLVRDCANAYNQYMY